MGCACNKGKKNVVYIYTSPKGQQTSYTSETQAKAARIRNGGGSITERAR